MATAGASVGPWRTRARIAETQGCLLVASSGGHLFQLFQLRDGFDIDQRHWVTFDTTDAKSLLAGDNVTWAYHPTNRNVPNLLRNIGLAFKVVRRLRPRTIVTTGAGVAVPFCWVGRLFGARIIYIESYARVSEPSLTGRLVHPVAHEFYVQWPEMQEHFKKARYRGALV
jgi:beta-1,4-N-acetylglucosaminyltransferase